MTNPPPGPPWQPPPPPAQRNDRTLLVALLAGVTLLVVVLAGAGTFFLLRSEGDGNKSSSGPADLREPLVFRPVVKVGQPPCAPGMLKEFTGATCYEVGTGGLTVRRVERIQVLAPAPESGQTSWRIAIKLTSADAPEFGRLSLQAYNQQPPANQIAIIVGDQVVSAPTMASAITGGALEITGTFTRTSAEDMIQRMTGRTGG